MDMSWTSHGQPSPPSRRSTHGSVGEHPAHAPYRLERTTGFEPATLTLAKVMDLVRRLGCSPAERLVLRRLFRPVRRVRPSPVADVQRVKPLPT